MSSNSQRSHLATSSQPRVSAPGVISTVEIYTLREAKARLGWTDSAYRAARRRGLEVIRDGKRAYIAGQEIQRYLASISHP